MQTALALDCSFAGLSLTLRTATGELFAFTTAATRSSDLLPTALANLFTESATTVANLTHIYVTTGPGSFTGIRLGLATAEALKLVNPAIEIIGFSTLQALAQQIVTEQHPTEPFTLVLDAAGGQTYTQTFTPTGLPQTEAVCTPVNQSPVTSHQSLLYAQSSLLLSAHPLETLNTTHLFTLAENPANYLPATPVYLKPLTYKLAP